MEKTIRSHKWQEEVRYDDNDITWNGTDWTEPGTGSLSGNTYTIVFDEMREYNEFWCRDIRRQHVSGM